MKSKKLTRMVALALCVFLCAGIAMPMMGAAFAMDNSEEPGAVCACDVKCTEDAPDVDCPVCAVDVTTCAGCICDAKCAEEMPNNECPACALDAAACAVCVCDVTCAADAPNSECPVCAADAAGCLGVEPEPAPVCDCTIQCELGAVKGDCPICKNDLTGCTGQEPEPVPESGIDIKITPPSEWATREADVEIRITDSTGGGFALVQAKVEKNGSWQDMTDELEEKNGRYYGTLEISENCTVYVSVTGWDEKTYEKSRYIECFDRTAPTLRASIDGRLLRAEGSDDLSGVAAIYIDGEKYTGLTNGTLDVPLRELGDDFEQFSIQAVDAAGNKSKIVQLDNPNYEEPEDESDKPAQECPEATETPAATTTTTTTPTTPAVTTTPTVPATPSTSTSSGGTTTGSGTAASGAATVKTSTTSSVTQEIEETEEEPRADAPLTPDGQATVVDNVTDEDGKEFFTITTPDENIFFLVIDRQRESENVYFLNAVTESDLLALAVEDEEEPVEEAVPDPEPVCECGELCEPGAVDRDCPVCVLNLKDCTGEAPAVTEEPEEPKDEGSGMGTIIFILIAALAAGGAGYYFKIYKPRHDLDDAEDFDELTGGELEEETVNEDAEPVPQAALPSEPEPDGEPDYPDDDPYDDPYAGQ